mgnify:CR=1 FL=1
MNVPAIITGILVLGGCSGFVKPDYRIDSAVVGQQHAIQNIQVTIKEQNKAHVYNHCVWLNAQCYGEPYEEMRRELQNALGDALALNSKLVKKPMNLTVDVLKLQVEPGLRSKATAKMSYRLTDMQSGRDKFTTEIESEGNAFQVGFSHRESLEQNQALNQAVQNNLSTFVQQLQTQRILSF